MFQDKGRLSPITETHGGRSNQAARNSVKTAAGRHTAGSAGRSGSRGDGAGVAGPSSAAADDSAAGSSNSGGSGAGADASGNRYVSSAGAAGGAAFRSGGSSSSGSSVGMSRWHLAAALNSRQAALMASEDDDLYFIASGVRLKCAGAADWGSEPSGDRGRAAAWQQRHLEL